MPKRKSYHKYSRAANLKRFQIGTGRPYKVPRRVTKEMINRVANSRTGGLVGEQKYIDRFRLPTTLLAAPAATAPTGGEHDPVTFECLNSMIVGSGSSERIGRKIVCKSVYVTGTVYTSVLNNINVGHTPPSVMLALVLDKQTNATHCQSEDVWTNPGASALMGTELLRNLEQSTRFQILWTKRYIFPVQTGAGESADHDNNGTQIKFKIFKKLNLPVLFKDSGGNVSSINDNSLHLFGFVDATATNVLLRYQSRVRFVG